MGTKAGDSTKSPDRSKRGKSGRFGVGNQAGKGHGRPKVALEFKAECRVIVDELVVERWRSEVESMGEHWVRCSELLAAYGYGKPPQSLTVAGTVNHEHRNLKALNDEQLDVLIALMERAEAAAEPAPEPH